MRRALRCCGYSALIGLAAVGAACGESERGLKVNVHYAGAGGASGGVGLATGGIVTSGTGGIPSGPIRCTTDPPLAPVVRKSVADLDGSLNALFGDGPLLASAGPPEQGYYRPLSSSFVVALRQVITQRVQTEVGDDTALRVCAPDVEEQPSCVEPWLRDWGEKIYGQPLTDEQVGAYSAQFDGALSQALTPAEAARNSLLSMLLSPYFVLRIEFGAELPSQTLTPHELAGRISHFAMRRSPDAALLASAASGALNDPTEMLAQYQRLAGTPEGRAARELHHLEWLGLASPLQRPDLDAELAADMETQARLLLTEVFDHQGGTLSSLLMASSLPLNDRLANNYGVPSEPGDGFRVTDVSTLPFAGMLTTGAFLARFRAPSRRGQQISEALLCSTVPDPPLDHPDATLGQGETPRERLAASLGDNPACIACHQVVDPPGLALEAFDDQARLSGADTSGGYVDAQNGSTNPIPVSGPRELGNLIATSAAGRRCALRHYLELALDRRLADDRNSDPGPPAKKDAPPPIPIIRDDPDVSWLDCLTNTLVSQRELDLTAVAEAIVVSTGFASHISSPRRVIALDSSVEPLEHAARETAQLVEAFQEINDEQTLQRYATALRDAAQLTNLPGAGEAASGGAGAAPAAGGAP
jgi:hypothetical protein